MSQSSVTRLREPLAEGRHPNPVDSHVGLRLRARRKGLKISQEQLGEALGITFQQVQKYERGANRISASKLFEAARVLDVPPGWFFEGLDHAAPAGTQVAEPTALDRLPTAACGMALAEAFVVLPTSDQALVTAVAASLARHVPTAFAPAAVNRAAA